MSGPISPAQRREIIRADLQQKFEAGDWHGVMDCAADLREHDAFQRGRAAGIAEISADPFEPWPPGPWSPR